MTPSPPLHTITALELGPMENFIYLIHDHKSGRVAVVDPAWDAQAILARVREQGLRITDILLTHSHNDHINALDALLEVSDAITGRAGRVSGGVQYLNFSLPQFNSVAAVVQCGQVLIVSPELRFIFKQMHLCIGYFQ